MMLAQVILESRNVWGAMMHVDRKGQQLSNLPSHYEGWRLVTLRQAEHSRTVSVARVGL